MMNKCINTTRKPHEDRYTKDDKSDHKGVEDNRGMVIDEPIRKPDGTTYIKGDIYIR